MAKEIERKFLVRDESWRASAFGTPIRQGYLAINDASQVRVRICGDQSFLTVKGGKRGFVRAEYEYEIPLEDADEMLRTLCEGSLIEKTRYKLTHGGREWVVDVFEGENAGLELAEVELKDETETVEVPAWAGEEVTDDPRYLNANLVKAPYRRWGTAPA